MATTSSLPFSMSNISKVDDTRDMSIRIAQGLAMAAFVVLMVYGADAAAKEAGTGGFLKIDTMTRGAVFGGSAVVLSTAAFFVSMRHRSLLVSSLLIANGIVMTVGGIMATENHIQIDVAPGPYIFLSVGLWVVALGIAKSILAMSLTFACFIKWFYEIVGGIIIKLVIKNTDGKMLSSK